MTDSAGMDWLTLAVQAGGAIAVCAMFLWFLSVKQKNDDEAREAFMNHMRQKDEQMTLQTKELLQHMADRDQTSKTIAESGHDALRQVAAEVKQLQAEIRSSR